MNRISDENGTDAGTRNVGRFFLALVPWALAIGLSAWGGMWVGIHNYKAQLAQEKRAAQYVGAETRPTDKIAIVVVSHDCSKLTRVDIDGSNMMMYATNTCHKNLSYFAWYWQGISPDGTVVADGYTNQCAIPSVPGDKAECRQEISTDDRIKTIRVWTQIGT